jgi:hypothetical protein
VKIGVAIPLDVHLPPLPEGGRAELVVDTPALGPQTGTVVTSTIVPFDAVPDVPRELHLSVVLSDVRRPITVRLFVAGREVLRRAVSIDPNEVAGRIVAAVSDTRAGLGILGLLPERVVAAYLHAADLPRSWLEYGAIDLLVLRDGNSADLDEAQRRALLMWLKLGGHLLVIPEAGRSAPSYLKPVLPAVWGNELEVLPPSRGEAPSGPTIGPAVIEDSLPRGPYPLTSLEPRRDAAQIRVDGITIAARGSAGRGIVSMWAFDPWDRPFLDWPGRLRLLSDALGDQEPPLIDPGMVADRLPSRPRADPIVHLLVGGAIALYIAAIYALRRWGPQGPAALAALIVAAVAVGVFSAIGSDVRRGSTSLVQVTFLEPSPATALARALTVTDLTVPYGGAYVLRAPSSSLAGPVTPSGDLRIELTPAGTVLLGRLPSGRDIRGFWSLGVASAKAEATFEPKAGTLTLDAGDQIRQAELRWRGRRYPLGDLPSGSSVVRLHADRWILPEDAYRDDQDPLGFFVSLGDAMIVDDSAPVLVGRLEREVPGFIIDGTAGTRFVILVIPLARR